MKGGVHMVILSDEIVSLLKEYMDAVTDSDGDYILRSANQLVGALEIAFAMSKSTITAPSATLIPKDFQITSSEAIQMLQQN